MSKSTLVGAAMIAAAAVAVPVLAWSQAPAPAAASPQAGAGDDDRGGMHPGWMGHATHMNRSPQQACVDHIARRAGFVASMGFRLDLTAEQKPLWDKVVAATQTAQDNQRKLCASLPASADDRGKETIIDRMNHRQQMLQGQLQALQHARPPVPTGVASHCEEA
jgi:hypothetical protein